MDTKRKIILLFNYSLRLINELIIDLYAYYFNVFAALLIAGTFRRIKRRYKVLFLPKGKGRPPISEDLVRLIIDMKRSNPGWGALRISQELALLGISIHKKTVQKILKESGFMPPRLKFVPPTWAALIKSYRSVWSMDFMSVFDAFGSQMFVLVIIDIKSRTLISINATLNPNRSWIIQQFRNIAISDIPFPRVLISDNDGIYGNWLVPILKEYFEIEVKKIPPKMLWFNGVCERFHRTLREELFNRLVLHDQSHVQLVTSEFKGYYNLHRPHQGIDGKIPSGKVINFPRKSANSEINYRKIDHLNGLITRFELAA